MNSFHEPLRGIIPPLVTPLAEPDKLDVAGLERLIEHEIAGGVTGIFILGTTGELPSLSHRLREELIERTCSLVDGRVHVLVGVTDPSIVESVRLAGHAEEAGADAVVLTAPYYFPIDAGELTAHFERIIPQMPLPVCLYNMPVHTKTVFSLDTIRRAMDFPNTIGVKDSSGDMVYFQRVRKLTRERPDWTLLVGPEELLPAATMFGGDGGVCGGANLQPQLYVDIFNAADRGDFATAMKLHERVMAISESLYSVGGFRSSFIRGIKAALACVGLCEPILADPFECFNETELAEIRRRLDKLGIRPISTPIAAPVEPAPV